MKKLFILIIPALLIMLAFQPVVSHTIEGTITDQTDHPVSGVSIKGKGTTSGVYSDRMGKYRITVSNSLSILIFSALGYETQEIRINGNSEINVILKSSSAKLEEVVVTGISQNNEKKDQMFSPAISQSISGKVAGLQDRKTKGYYRSADHVFENFNTEGYDYINENRFLKAVENPLSTFSIDVDAASYTNIRRFLNQGQLPPSGAVRIEEMINYFHYDYPQPINNDPFSINTEISAAPWNKDHKLVLIGLQGKKIPIENLPASNLVFLIDVSGSMGAPNKLPLVKASMKMLVDQLREQDRVAIVVYAGAAGLVLPSTSGGKKTMIKDAIDRLESGGSTAGGAGIKLAYETAKKFMNKEGNNRVILCTDGDFNIGESSDDAMERLIEEERKSGIFLSVLGYGMGNYKDNKMQKLADKGNGNHAYIDGMSEAKKVLVNEFGGTLFTIAKDVKLQIEFNPVKVQGYRLIGYENRMLAKEDFNDDKKDAGELGSGHTVTALYEIIPVGVKSDFLKSVEDLKYQGKQTPLSKSSNTDEIMTVKFRYKAPDGGISRLIEHPIKDQYKRIENSSENFRFAASVAEFGMLLRNSQFKSSSSFENVIDLARNSRGNDDEGYRSEFIRLVQSAQLLAKNKIEPGNELSIEKKKSGSTSVVGTNK